MKIIKVRRAVILASFLAGPLVAAGCQSKDAEYIKRCNLPTATLDDPDMWNCYLHDQPAHVRLLAKKKAESDARFAAIDADAKIDPGKYDQPRAPSTTCRGTIAEGGYARMTCNGL